MKYQTVCITLQKHPSSFPADFHMHFKVFCIRFTFLNLVLILPATLLVGVQTTNEMDEMLRDELFGHDKLHLVKVGPLLLGQHRHGLQISTTVRVRQQQLSEPIHLE